jgi:Golgi nucleoside diphosphatase
VFEKQDLTFHLILGYNRINIKANGGGANTMFSFDKQPYEIIEKNVLIDDIRRKYPDNIMITINGCVKDRKRHGDVVAILTAEEYLLLREDLPNDYSMRFSTIKGINILNEEKENYLGFIT